MPVYHFTIHGHGTWLPDQPRGYVQRRAMVRTQDARMAWHSRDRMRHPKVEFTPELLRVLLLGTHDVCRRRGWR